MNLKTVCLHCKETIKGRSDKKFCDDHCRSAYNNNNYTNRSSLVKTTHKTLQKNRHILQTLNTTGKSKVSRKALQDKGFDFSYFTGIYHTGKGATYVFCYEMGYLSLRNEEVLLVRKIDFPRWHG
ncbi:hypothetical protein [Pedobacter heparinus]|uniref:hypothetical protein n=1 Tax=Pedobacter heparinus TaxID=984 RepID=UPI00293052E1|nr:hypothetical protein [Pedobacter heparinus]